MSKVILSSGLVFGLLASFTLGWFMPNPSNTESMASIPPTLLDAQALSFDPKPLPDFTKFKNVTKKKKTFFSYLLPYLRQANDEIRSERKWLLALLQQDTLSQDDMQTMLSLADKYEVSTLKPNGILKELIKRVDIIPVSMALAQAANESAWGTSRFARKGNNLFGQWCFVKGCGLVPLQQVDGQHYEVAQFDHPMDSIRSYMRNLNSHYTYESMRDQRQALRNTDQMVTGLTLSEELVLYSTRREHYVMEIQTMILQNKLGQYDLKKAPLKPSAL